MADTLRFLAPEEGRGLEVCSSVKPCSVFARTVQGGSGGSVEMLFRGASYLCTGKGEGSF
jgi:hypothetical protein